jgi:phenylalanyl-tRNA synthetase beta chain
MEDVGIAYGFNKLPRMSPNKTATIGTPQPIQKLSDIVRHECAYAGWMEVMPLILCSHDENFKFLNREDKGEVVKLANPKSLEFQVVRTSLLPGLLKTIRENKNRPLPMKIFETADIVLKDEKAERRVSKPQVASLKILDAELTSSNRPRTSGTGVPHSTESRLDLRRHTDCE